MSVMPEIRVQTAMANQGPLSQDQLSRHIDSLLEQASRDMVEATRRYEIYRLAAAAIRGESAYPEVS